MASRWLLEAAAEEFSVVRVRDGQDRQGRLRTRHDGEDHRQRLAAWRVGCADAARVSEFRRASTAEKVQADDNGNIESTEFEPDEHDVDVRFYLTAYGTASQATTTFTDAVTETSTAIASNNNPSNFGDNVKFTATVTCNACTFNSLSESRLSRKRKCQL